VLLLQEVEDWHLELREREPGLSRQGHGAHRGAGSGPTDGSHQGIDAPQSQELRPTRGATHFRILFVFERNATGCFWWPATRPGTGGPWYDTKIRSPSIATGQWIKKQEGE
jgi:hypothetical protein